MSKSPGGLFLTNNRNTLRLYQWLCAKEQVELYMDKGLDTGNIIVQKKVALDEKIETFVSSYQKLNEEIIALFKVNWEAIKSRKVKSVE